MGKEIAIDEERCTLMLLEDDPLCMMEVHVDVDDEGVLNLYNLRNIPVQAEDGGSLTMHQEEEAFRVISD